PTIWRGAADVRHGTTGASPSASGFAVPDGRAEVPVGRHKMPLLRVLGQVSQSYVVTEGPDGVYLVDQHAAHERILLERMVAEWRARAVSSQSLLEALPVELGPAERDLVEAPLEQPHGIGVA